tara:strand:+ start:846 stop:1304 length:459 start_codon:yes stop_codon:yes gene_type:complete
MLAINELFDKDAIPSTTLTLPFDQRQKSRLRVTLDNGKEASLILARGIVLRQGDLLKSTDGQIIKVCAANEKVSTVYGSDSVLLKACYHLGNRHVPLQIAEGWLRYQRDHVLDDMVRILGLSIQHEETPFEPESGAYMKGSEHQPHIHNHEH